MLAVAMAMVFTGVPVSAADDSEEPTELTGTLALVSAEQSVRTAGKNMIVTLQSKWDVAGDLVGTFYCHPRAVIFASGETFVSEWGVYNVTWGDLEGTMRVRSVGWSVGEMKFHMDATIVGGGTGDLAGLRGYGTVDLNYAEGSAVYSFEVFWEE